MSIPYDELKEHFEKMKRTDLEIVVKDNSNYQILAEIVAKSIKMLEMYPDISIDRVIASLVKNSVPPVKEMEIIRELSPLIGQIELHGFKYIDIALVINNDGESSVDRAQINLLRTSLTGILGAERIKMKFEITGKKLEEMDREVMQSVQESRRKMGL